jgi:RecB family exonuclease
VTHSVHASAIHLPVVDSAHPYSHARLRRFGQCPLSYRLHYLDRLPAAPSAEAELGRVLHRTLEDLVRDHVRTGRKGPLDGAIAAAMYQRLWSETQLSTPAVFGEGLALVKRWVAREGVVDPEAVLGLEREFELEIAGVRLVGALDRVDRIAPDAVRIRDYTSGRIPPSRQEVDESLQLALCDLAAAQLWPWARRIEVGLDLLRHDRVVWTERSEAQREATWRYVRAMVDRIETAQDYPARLGTLCTHCDQRTHCPAYRDALSATPTPATAATAATVDEGDLAAVAREREELAGRIKIATARKDALDEVLTQRLARQDELVLEGRRYRLVTATRKDYPLEPTLDALAAAGVDRAGALARIGRADAQALRRELDELGAGLDPDRLAALKATLEASAKHSLSTRLTSTEVAS